MSALRVRLVGFGMVGRWVAGALGAQADQLASRYGRGVRVVGIGNARDGFVYDPDGLDLGSVLAAGGRPVTAQPGARGWPSAIDGLRATEADLLVEVTASSPADGEPGLTHMREALQRGIPVVTSNKWPVALHRVELAALAWRRGAAFRAESTVMSGTPVLSTLTEGLAGAVPAAMRGVLNATANCILSQMADGSSYQDALAAAQRSGLAERDPAADVEGYDTAAKLMILSALVFGRQLRRDEVACRGITGVTSQQARDAAAADGRLRHVAALTFAAPGGTGAVTARVQPEALPADDPLARIDGVANALVYQASPIGQIMITGPGAGPQLAGQGVLADILAVARCPAKCSLSTAWQAAGAYAIRTAGRTHRHTDCPAQSRSGRSVRPPDSRPERRDCARSPTIARPRCVVAAFNPARLATACRASKGPVPAADAVSAVSSGVARFFGHALSPRS